jgi:hypothetical protein
LRIVRHFPSANGYIARMNAAQLAFLVSVGLAAFAMLRSAARAES